jgi:hypothetical protein
MADACEVGESERGSHAEHGEHQEDGEQQRVEFAHSPSNRIAFALCALSSVLSLSRPLAPGARLIA